MSKTQYTMPQVVRLLNVPYDKVRHAVRYKAVVKPRCYGKTLVFNAEQVETLRAFLALTPQEQRRYNETMRFTHDK